MDMMFGMPAENIKVHCTMLLDELRADPNFATFLDYPSGRNFDEWSMNRGPECEVQAFRGECKGVIIEDGAPYVIKIPFFHYGTREDAKAVCAPLFDYCRAEARNYALAVKEDVACYFAPCYKLMDYVVDEDNTIPVYVMEYVECDACDVREKCYDLFYAQCVDKYGADYTEDWDGEIMEFDDLVSSWYEDMESEIDILLEDQFREGYVEFSSFCANNYINDLHPGNVGTDRFGCLKVIDYSGFGQITAKANEREWWNV